jgi:tetratricopeptide (TPR) repeat protein
MTVRRLRVLLREALMQASPGEGATRIFEWLLEERGEQECRAACDGFLRLARFDLDDPVYRLALAACYQLAGRYREAAACYDLIAQLAPDDTHALWLGALCWRAQGRNGECCRRLAVLRRLPANARLRRRAAAALVFLRWRARRNFRVF